MANVRNHIIFPDRSDLPKRVTPMTLCGLRPIPGTWARFWGRIEDIGCQNCLHTAISDGHSIAALSNGANGLQGITEPTKKEGEEHGL